jgi:hypothetical protein
MEPLDAYMKENRFQADANSPKTAFNSPFSNHILALAGRAAQMLLLGLNVDDDVAGLILRFQVFLILEPEGMVQRAL